MLSPGGEIEIWFRRDISEISRVDPAVPPPEFWASGVEARLVGVWMADLDGVIPEDPWVCPKELRFLPDRPDPWRVPWIAIDGERIVKIVAFYWSFRYDCYWGIYVDVDALQDFAIQMFGGLRGQFTDCDLLRLALGKVFQHELFHYRTDMAAALMEFIAQSPVYLPYRNTPRNLEEALANAYAWHRLRSVRPNRHGSSLPAPVRAWLPYLEQGMNNQPSGYRDWGRYRKRADFEAGLRRLASDMLTAVSLPGSQDICYAPFENLFPRSGTVPVYFYRIVDYQQFKQEMNNLWNKFQKQGQPAVHEFMDKWWKPDTIRFLLEFLRVYGVPRPEELSRQQIEEKLEEYLRDWQKKATTPPTILSRGSTSSSSIQFRLAYGSSLIRIRSRPEGSGTSSDVEVDEWCQPATIHQTDKFSRDLKKAPRDVQSVSQGIIKYGEWSPLRLRRVSRGCIHYRIGDHVIVFKYSGQDLQACELRKAKASGGSSTGES
jgi:hypothetical protein